MAWFRFLTFSSVREHVKQFMDTTLKEMGDTDAELNDQEEKTSSNADINTTAQNARFTNWPVDKTTSTASNDPGYGALRFPKFSAEGEPEPAFKSVWHGIEENWSMPGKDLFFDESTVNRLRSQHNVEISWNYQMSVLYIASFRCMDDVNKTVATLDKMIKTEVR